MLRIEVHREQQNYTWS